MYSIGRKTHGDLRVRPQRASGEDQRSTAYGHLGDPRIAGTSAKVPPRLGTRDPPEPVRRLSASPEATAARCTYATDTKTPTNSVPMLGLRQP
jgi:hypothetical protein